MGCSNQQTPSQMSDDFMQYLSSVISYQESCPSESGGSFSSMMGPPTDAPQVAGTPDSGSQFDTTNLRTNLQDTSQMTNGQSAFPRCCYLPNCVNNNPCFITTDYLPAQQQTFQTSQLYSFCFGGLGNQFSFPTYAPQLIHKKPRLEFPSSLNPVQIPTPDVSTSAVPLYQQQTPTPQSVPSPQMLMQPKADRKQLVSVDAVSGAACYRRLMSYIYHIRKRPVDNNIAYWRKFVSEYYSTSSSTRRRWCLSKCDDVGSHAHGIDYSWKCDLCLSLAGKGFEVTYEALPRMFEIFFKSGVVEEILYLDTPAEKRYPSGHTVLFFEKAVQENVYKQFRVVHKGQLRIVFTPELKIILWEFCIRSHDELVPRRLVKAQVNELVERAEKCQYNSQLGESKVHDLMTNCHRVLAAGGNLATSLQLPIVNELGFSKPFVRSMQISEVFNSMNGLMTSCLKPNSSPIETLKRYRRAANAKLKEPMEDKYDMQQTPNSNIILQQPPNFIIQTPNAKILQQTPKSNTILQQPPNFIPQTPNAKIIQQTPNSNIILQPPPNSMTQTPNAKNMLNSPSYYQNFQQHRTSSDLQHNPNIKPTTDSAAKNSEGASTSRQEPTVQQKINDLLAYMRAEEDNRKRAQIAKGKDILVYDVNYGDSQVGVFTEQNGVVENGKGLNYSSSSNSSAKIFADNCVVKREEQLDDDSSSPNGHYQEMNM